MAPDTMDSGQMGWLMDKAFFTTLTVMYTKVNLDMTRQMGTEYIHIKRAPDMKALGKMI